MQIVRSARLQTEMHRLDITLVKLGLDDYALLVNDHLVKPKEPKTVEQGVSWYAEVVSAYANRKWG